MKTNEIKIQNLRVCNLTEPLGFAMERPVFSWTAEGDGGEARAVSLRIRAGGETVFESGDTPRADSLGWAVPWGCFPGRAMTIPSALRPQTANTPKPPPSSRPANGRSPGRAAGSAPPGIEIPPCCAGAFPAKSGRGPRVFISAAWAFTRPISTARRLATSTWPQAITPTTFIWRFKPTT